MFTTWMFLTVEEADLPRSRSEFRARYLLLREEYTRFRSQRPAMGSVPKAFETPGVQ